MRYLLTVILIFSLEVSLSQEKKKVNVFEKPGDAKPFHPNDRICFDYKVNYKGVFNGRSASGCFLINTQSGAVLSFGFDQPYQSDCKYNLQDKNFNAYLTTLKGNTYSYFNSVENIPNSRNTQLKHYVRTGNTEPSSPENIYNKKMFYHKGDFKEFTRELKGRKYTSNDGISVYILIDDNFPDAFESYQLLGAYGLGFLETSKGNFLVLGYAAGKTESDITTFKKVAGSVCFTAAGFRKEEQTRTRVATTNTEIEANEINKQIGKAKVSSSSCAALKVKFYEEQKRQTEQKKEMLEYLSTNRVNAKNQNDMQRAYGKYDSFATYLLMRLEAEYKICDISEALAKNQYKKQEEVGKATTRKNCLKAKVIELKKTETEAADLKRTYRNNNTQLVTEQQKLMRKIHDILKNNRCN
jgi:hypothetical protein